MRMRWLLILVFCICMMSSSGSKAYLQGKIAKEEEKEPEKMELSILY